MLNPSVFHLLLLEVQSAAGWVALRLPANPASLADDVPLAEHRDETCQMFVLWLPDATTALSVFRIMASASWSSLGEVNPAAVITEWWGLCCSDGSGGSLFILASASLFRTVFEIAFEVGKESPFLIFIFLTLLCLYAHELPTKIVGWNKIFNAYFTDQ